MLQRWNEPRIRLKMRQELILKSSDKPLARLQWLNNIISLEARYLSHVGQVRSSPLQRLKKKLTFVWNLELERAQVRARRPGLNTEPALHKPKARQGPKPGNCTKTSGLKISEPESLVWQSPSPTRYFFSKPEPGPSPLFQSLFLRFWNS